MLRYACIAVLFLTTTGIQAGTNTWTPLGPFAACSHYEFHPANKNIIFCSTPFEIFRSTDDGFRWQGKSLESVPGFNVNDQAPIPVRIHQQSPHPMFAAVSGIIIHSADLGNTWEVLSKFDFDVADLQLDPQDVRVLYALKSDYSRFHKIYKSVDGGRHWSRILARSDGIAQIVIDPTNGKILYALTGTHLLKTLDGGKSWHTFDHGLPGDGYRWALAISRSEPKTLYALVDGCLHNTMDGGQTWHRVSCNDSMRAISVDAQNNQIVYAVALQQALESINGGVTWRQLTLPNLVISILSEVKVSPLDGSFVFLAGNGKSLRSIDAGASWQVMANGHPGNGGAIKIRPGPPGEIFFFDSDLYHSTNRGQTWFISNTGFPKSFGVFDLQIHAVNPNLAALVGYQYGANISAIGISTDNGKNWKFTQTPFSGSGLVLDPKDQNVIYARGSGSLGKGVYKSTDLGKSWKVANSGLTDRSLTTMAIDQQNPNRLFAGTAKNQVFQSDDGARTWLKRSAGIPLSPGNDDSLIYTILIDPENTNVIYSGTKGLYKSIDGGLNWSAKSQGLPADLLVTYIALLPGAAHTLVTGGTCVGTCSSTIFTSSDGGESWIPFSRKGLPPNTWTGDFSIDPLDPHRYLISTIKGIYTYTSRP